MVEMEEVEGMTKGERTERNSFRQDRGEGQTKRKKEWV